MIEGIEETIEGVKISSIVHFYMDDIYLAGRLTSENHVKALVVLLRQIIAWGFKIKLSKCKFMVQECTILGLPLDPYFLKLDENKVQAGRQFAPPINKTQLRGFLGLVGYTRNFIKDFAKRASVL